MPAKLQTYLFFNGRCQEAAEFYRKAVGVETVMSMRFDEAPDKPPPGMVPDNWGDKIMHMEMRIGENLLLASDGHSPNPAFNGFRLVYETASEAECKRAYDALRDGGTVDMPLGPTFFAKSYAMLTDKFGVGWMVILPAEQFQ